MKNDIKYEISANLEVNKFCNFRCQYCFGSNKIKSKPEFKGQSIEKIINGFNICEKKFWIRMSGGEPFLAPDFVKLCEGLIERHYISVNTNLSAKNVYDFADSIDPKKVISLDCALHIDERKRKNMVDDFINKCHYLKDKGFNIITSQVLYPPILENFDEIYNFFKENDIIIKPKIFRGLYRYRHYPNDYTNKQRQRILVHIKIAEELNDPQFEKELIYGDMSFKGQFCKAGIDFVSINYSGDIIRCPGVPTKMGNLFEGKINLFEKSKICTARFCPCGYDGLINADGRPKIVSQDLKYYLDNLKIIARHILKP